MRKEGFFISFEGGEGSGKTTQINKLAEALTAQGHRVLTTREPGGTDEGNKIREFIVQRDGGNWTPMAEALLLLAARTMHVEKVIKPALEDGKVVISDRFSDSTIAYQGYGHGLDLDVLKQLDELAISGLKPDLTLVLDIPPTDGLERANTRMQSETYEEQRAEDRFERLDVSFHEKIRQAFLDIAASEKERCVVIDAAQSISEMSNKIEAAVTERLR